MHQTRLQVKRTCRLNLSENKMRLKRETQGAFCVLSANAKSQTRKSMKINVICTVYIYIYITVTGVWLARGKTPTTALHTKGRLVCVFQPPAYEEGGIIKPPAYEEGGIHQPPLGTHNRPTGGPLSPVAHRVSATSPRTGLGETAYTTSEPSL